MKKTMLVTGGTGFLGLHLVAQLLNRGYLVRTTVRNLNKQTSVIETLRVNQIKNLENLTFFQADLNSDAGWSDAMTGVDGVFSVASPVFFDEPKDENEAIKPAIEGIERILRIANEVGIEKVVMTSNFGAVGFSRRKSSRSTTENDWTDEDQAGLSLYEKSKLIAEKRAWEYVDRADVHLKFATVNPVAMLGPSLNSHVSGSFDILQMLLAGKNKRMVNLPLNIVDVLDVAELHILAMESSQADQQRFIATADGQIDMVEMAQIIRQLRPKLANRVPRKTIPNALINIAAIFNSKARAGKLFLKMNRKVSNQKAKRLLGWQPHFDNQAIVLSSIDQLVKKAH